MIVSEIMTSDVRACAPENDLAAAAKAMYRLEARPPYPVTISIRTDASGKAETAFELTSGSKVRLQKTSGLRMDGIQEDPNGKTWNVRLWKKTSPAPANVRGFLGTWEGIWANGLPVRMEVKHIDATAASLLYSWVTARLNDGSSMEAGWSWFNARVTDKGELEFKSFDGQRTFTFDLTKNQKYVDGYISGMSVPNSIRMERSAQ